MHSVEIKYVLQRHIRGCKATLLPISQFIHFLDRQKIN